MNIHVENPVIELHNLTVSYQNKPAVWNLDYTLPEGSMVGIIGPNGSGKTTQLKCIMDLLKPDSGYVKIFNNDLSNVRHRVAYVPQRGSVDWDFPINVIETVLMGRYKPGKFWQKIDKKDYSLAHEALAKVHLDSFSTRQISQLSGGQQQRVFIARALAQNADLYLLDEPFAGVDAATEAAIFQVLNELKQSGKTVVVVHHDLQTAARYFDWIIMMNTRLIASGPTSDVFNAENLNETYGGKLQILHSVADLLKQQSHSVRE